MKPTVISADVLFEDHRATLRWHWIAGLEASERRFDDAAISQARSSADLVGYLNYIHPYRVQILGEREVAYLTNGSREDCARRVARIVTLEPPVLVLCDGQTAPDALLSMCERAQIPMFATHESAAFVIDVLRAFPLKGDAAGAAGRPLRGRRRLGRDGLLGLWIARTQLPGTVAEPVAQPAD